MKWGIFMLKTLTLGLDVLKMFTRDKTEWGGRELAHELQMNHTKIYRVLETLDNNNFLSKDPETKKYKLGFATWELGMIMYEGLNVGQLIRPSLKQLSDQTGESVFLTVLDKHEAVTLEVIEPTNKVKFSVSAGSRAPLYVGASYRAILAYMPEVSVETIIDPQVLKKYTKNTLVDPYELKKDLAKIRKQGWAISQGEYTEDVIAIAVPLFDNNEIIGSITISGPTYRMVDEEIAKYPSLLRNTRDEVAEVITRYQLKLKA